MQQDEAGYPVVPLRLAQNEPPCVCSGVVWMKNLLPCPPDSVILSPLFTAEQGAHSFSTQRGCLIYLGDL